MAEEPTVDDLLQQLVDDVNDENLEQQIQFNSGPVSDNQLNEIKDQQQSKMDIQQNTIVEQENVYTNSQQIEIKTLEDQTKVQASEYSNQQNINNNEDNLKVEKDEIIIVNNKLEESNQGQLQECQTEQFLQNVFLHNNLLHQDDLATFQINPQEISHAIDKIKGQQDKNLKKVQTNQNLIITQFQYLKPLSQIVFDNVNLKDKQFLKKTIKDKQLVLKEIGTIQNNTNKFKTFIMMTIKRLENIEYDLDTNITTEINQIKELEQQLTQISNSC